VEITLSPDRDQSLVAIHTILEWYGRGEGSRNHVIEADTLRISPSAKDSVVQVDINVTIEHYGFGLAAAPPKCAALPAFWWRAVRPGLALALERQAGAAPLSI